MSAASRAAEAEEASVAFQFALAQIGAGTVEEALDLWKSVNPAELAATRQRWLTRAISLILSRRRMSRDLAFAYYRLARALRTGTTIADPYNPLKRNPTLGDVRREFASMVDDVASVSTPNQTETASNSTRGQSRTGQELEPGEAREGDDDILPVDDLPDLIASEDAVEADVEDEIRTDLEALGPDGLKRRLDQLRLDELTAREADALRAEAHRASGSRQSAAAERIVLNGGRGAVFNYANRDKKVLAYARVSASGTPCGWCAMLISRGAVYRSEASASLGEDGDLYHDNCHCHGEPIYSREQYDSNPLFDLNREYNALWPKVTKGYGGKDAVAIWRKYIREQHKAATQPKTFVREVISPTT